jgi:3alpha(or 20beta)-hydroxysteroid dehydrogenase
MKPEQKQVGRLEGKVALITGAARGQGEADARVFADEGALVILTDVMSEMGRETARRIGRSAHFYALDVSDEEGWNRVVADVIERYGRLDVLVNNAGIASPRSDLVHTSLNDFRRSIDVNLVGVFLGMKSCAQALCTDGGGAIVNIASTSALRASPRRIAYAATKFAVRGMTRVAALELAPLGVRVNCVIPGAVATEMLETAADGDEEAHFAALNSYLSRVPLVRAANADELARLVLFLASDESSYCTGGDFVADGGFLAN